MKTNTQSHRTHSSVFNIVFSIYVIIIYGIGFSNLPRNTAATAFRMPAGAFTLWINGGTRT